MRPCILTNVINCKQTITSTPVKTLLFSKSEKDRRCHLLNKLFSKKNVVIVGAARTPIGGYLGSLSKYTAPELGSIAIKAALSQANLKEVDECLMGNVVSAGVGQAPARQAALKAGLPVSTICTTINKVCSSGLKAVSLAAQSIQLGHAETAVAGGMESMSRAPFLVDGAARKGLGLGDGKLVDSLIRDGLWDPGHQIHMGMCAEESAKKFSIGRGEQDTYARESYERAQKAIASGAYKAEIVPVGEFAVDEEPSKANFAKFATLKPSFDRQTGTITAANASSLSDGAAAVVLCSSTAAKERNLRPLARIVAFADAEAAPIDFPTAPALAIPKALKAANLSASEISLFEINEAFSVVVLANLKILNIPREKVNVNGGAVALGHPIGASGCRILVSLINALKPGQFGCAAICNGGGGSTALIIQRE